MSDERFEQIHARPPVLILPGSPPPFPLPRGTPTCATHCSGRHETEGVMACRTCGTAKYHVLLHEYANQSGHYFYEMVPMNGAPPAGRDTPQCCNEPMVRRLL